MTLKPSTLFFAIASWVGFSHALDTATADKQLSAGKYLLPKSIDTIPKRDTQQLKYPLRDRRTDFFSTKPNGFDLKDPSIKSDSILYDPQTRRFEPVEKMGEGYYRSPGYLTFGEFQKLQAKKQEAANFRARQQLLDQLNRRYVRPKLQVSDGLFNRIFGGSKVDIRPNGYVDLMAGYMGQNVKNPSLPERARKNGGFDFDMNAQLNVEGSIGDKLRLPISYNTLANFDFENQIKLDYTGKDDEIIKRIEAGNVAFANKGVLIPGAQALFGVKTQLQFGKLFLTTVLSNQRSQRQTVQLQGGAAATSFNLRADAYEENKHFLLSQYFYDTYNETMKNLPVVNSQVQILRMEVWVTNRNGTTTQTRDIVGLMDLGEPKPFNNAINSLTGQPYPFNDANDLYRRVINNPQGRNPAFVQSLLTNAGLRPVQDFEKTFARKLAPTEYSFHPQGGYLSLEQQLQPDEVLGVAFQYTYNGRTFQVGEFSQDLPPDTTVTGSGTQQMLYLKLLKATSQRPNLPIWDLMMKNVYAVGFGALQREDFQLNILYEEPSLGEKRFLPTQDVDPVYQGAPIIALVNLDRLNNQNDPQPDGVFDFVEGFTIQAQRSRVIFPVIEPFGKDLAYVYSNNPASAQNYLYTPLYDSIKAIAQTFANLNRFIIRGKARTSGNGAEYNLGYNIPQGSVTITAGGQLLQENVDYLIDYNQGNVKIINQAILSTGLPVNIQFENNAAFGVQQKNFVGVRADYMVNNKLALGATMTRLGERPFFNKMVYGEDPIRNTMFGADFNYRSDVPRLSRWLDKLPFYNAQAMSTIQASGEAAMLKPGHAPQIGKGNNGLIYIDDFEGTRNSIDLRFPLLSWTLASTPQGAKDANGMPLLEEGNLLDSLPYGYNRARMAWYNIEPILQERRNPNNPLRGDLAELSKPETRAISTLEIFPQRTPDIGQNQLITFDLAFFPTERGPYNFDARPGSLDPTGKLRNPKKRWGGIMRALDQIDFETGNIEFIEFWLQDPFVNKPNSRGGELYFHLGNISEDILRDGRRQFENGLPTPNIQAQVDSATRWGAVPRNPLQITNAFSNDPADRPFQDVGLDGLQDVNEQAKFARYLEQISTQFGSGSPIYRNAFQDPSTDNYIHYRDAGYDASGAGIVERYKKVNSPQGNSPIATGDAQFTSAFTLYPDQEDLNRDYTLNELEEYFQYKVDLKPAMSAGANFITDKRVVNVRLADGSTRDESWYLFRIPIQEYQQKVGNIPDFKSIRFIRMFMTGFEDTMVVTRFARLELVRNQWRRFTYNIDTTGNYKPVNINSGTQFDVLAVNLEENDRRQPIPYRIPPDIQRVQLISNNNINLLQNEQSMSMRVCNLAPGDARGVFKTLNLDLRQFGKLSMFIHAESVVGQTPVRDRAMNAVIRIGTDFVSNYYEVKIPLKMTPFGTDDPNVIWPNENSLELDLQTLIKLKLHRNNQNILPSQYYKEVIDGVSYALIGNPNLGEVRGMLMGVENPKANNNGNLCTEVWFNELRLSRIDEKIGWAAVGRVDMQLSDLGTLSVSASHRSQGFGTLEQRVNERSREDFSQIDIATNLQLGKLMPQKWGMSIPMFATYSRTTITPEYDPYDLDIKLKTKLDESPSAFQDSIKDQAIEQVTTKTIAFSNVRKNRTTDKKPKVWDVENFDISYAYTKIERVSPLIESNEVARHRGGLGYNFTAQPKYWLPAKNWVRNKSPWLAWLREFNLNPAPSLLSFRADINRQFGAIRPRSLGSGNFKSPETYDKYYTFDRFYNLSWDVTKSIRLDFSAINNARVDEPPGRINTSEARDSVRSNFFRGGRTTIYNQNITLSYLLPTAKIPALDFVTMRLNYQAQYHWIGASRLAINLGNIAENSKVQGFTGEFNLINLYAKSRWLKALDEPLQPKAQTATANAQPKSKSAIPDSLKGKQLTRLQRQQLREMHHQERMNAPVNMSGLARVGGSLLTMVKRVSANYTESFNTRLPGFTDDPKILGNNWATMAPGMKFILGYQPDTNYLNSIAKKGWLTQDPVFNLLFQQNFDQKLNVTAQLQPFRDFTIDVNFDKSFSKNYTELFKDTVGFSNQFTRLSPYNAGGFSVSFISFQTLFGKIEPDQISATFKQFDANRVTLSKRLGEQNGYSSGPNAEGYWEGYGKYAQDVLVPSFLAAYTNKDPNKVPLLNQQNASIRSNPFRGYLPRPNWRLTYNGFTRIKGMEKYFTNFSMSHGYNSTLSMNNYTSALLYQDRLGIGFPSFVDTITGNFIPYFLVPNISISEAFSPLIDVDFTMTNQVSARFEYKKSRTLSLNLIDYQVSEMRSTEFSVGAGYRKRGLKMPFRLPFSKTDTRTLENDLNFRLDFSYRDDVMANSQLDKTNALGTGGQTVISILPSIDYVLNNRINLKLFFDQRRVTPKIANAAPLVNTRAGLQIRIAIAQ